MPQPHVIVIGGPNGAGKSTIAPMVLRDYLAIPDFVNADQIAAGLSAYDPEGAAFEAGRIMLRRLHELAGNGKSFAFESTLSSRTFAVFLAKLKREGYCIDLCYVWLNSVRLAQERVVSRVRMGGHSIPPDVIARRYERSLRNFRNMYLPIADNWRVYDNSDGTNVRLIARSARDSEIEIFEETSWNTIQSL